MPSVAQRIAAELGVAVGQVTATVDLLDGGATVPFVARYRKEATGGLDDAQLRKLEERLGYLRELDERRAAVLRSVEEQGKLDPALRAAIEAADTKSRLEDLYLPHKPRRRTRAMAAREAGLAPLAEALLAGKVPDPYAAAAAYVDAGKEVADADAALQGARAILVERFAEDPETVGELREAFWDTGKAGSRVKPGKEREGAKFADYFEFDEPFRRLPSHRILALLRGEAEGVLDLTFASDEDGDGKVPGTFERRIARRHAVPQGDGAGARWMAQTVGSAWRHRIRPAVETDARMRLKEAAEAEATRVFAANLRDLLLAAPAGARPTLGLDPGFRSGVKCAVVDATGKVVATETIYPHEPSNKWNESILALAKLCVAHRVELVAIGNGTASRETDRLVSDLLSKMPALKLTKAMVSEAGASVYSASEYASQELPGLDVTLRGAVSIARRLQDPLAELVKIEPKAIGVGQYQHDIDQHRLARTLDAVVEDCVNGVGVDVNMASARLLARVSGLGDWVAGNIVARRDEKGPFRSRAELLSVVGLGPRAYELSAGFLRIRDGDDPLDASGVHPEAYPVVRKIIDVTQGDLKAVMGNAKLLRGLKPQAFVDGKFGLPTVTDILKELEKPGRDPRPTFKTATFKEGVEKVSDLRPGMLLEGVVTNVAAFGAFVDVGVHQDGLVHVSCLSKDFVKDPSKIVKPGQVVRAKVLEVDVERKRISLTLRLDDPLPDPKAKAAGGGAGRGGPGRFQQPPQKREEAGGGAFAAAFAKAAGGAGKPGDRRR